MQTGIIIVAAGRGTRAGGAVPKQWQEVAGQPVARWTLRAFAGLGPIVMVIHPDDHAQARATSAGMDVRLVHGGADRATSVRAGLAALAEDAPDKVLIHDVARPCVSAEVIKRVLEALGTQAGAAPALAVTDALWTGSEGQVSGTKDRDGLYRAQTPQGFDFAQILAAHEAHPGGAADDVAVARAAGMEVAIVPGDEANLKITTHGDFTRAANHLRGNMDVRLGNGFDVHAFEDGDHVILCGVKIPHTQKLKGHSDADVGMHAVTDALYGALAEGDIGRHFPPSDPQWKGADSALFLRHAVDLARARGYAIGNIDLTLICERPKITPHAPEMITRMSDVMGLPGVHRAAQGVVMR